MRQTDLDRLCEQVAIEPRHMRCLLGEIRRYIPHAAVWAFGSRVTGTFLSASDLDLAVHCDKETALTDVPKLNEALIESDLPFKVQLLDYDRLPVNMQDNIKADYVVLCQPQEGGE